jgi:hypothetical protein
VTEQWFAMVPPVIRVFVFLDLQTAIFKDAPVLGSLIDPVRSGLTYLARTYHRDPPEFHAWLLGEWLAFLRYPGDTFAARAARYLEATP